MKLVNIKKVRKKFFPTIVLSPLKKIEVYMMGCDHL